MIGEDKPVETRSQLIVEADQLQCFTSNRTTDAHTALTRGLADYLRSLEFDLTGTSSQLAKLKEVYEDFADPEDKGAKFPSAAVYTQEPGTYEDDDFTSSPHELEDGYVIQICQEFTQIVCVDILTDQKPQRSTLVMLLEDAFEPVDWMSGFRLKLPHYFGVHATFLKVALDYMDSEANAQKHWRMAQFQLEARVTQIKFLGQVPRFQPKHRVEVSES